MPFVITFGYTTCFVALSTGMGYTNFPGSNLAINQNGSWAYVIANASGIVTDGAYANIAGSNTVIDFVPNQVVLPTPYTYGNTTPNLYSATFTLTSSGQTIQVRQHANRTVTADAFGSLTTPTGNYPSTLRTKTFESTIDSIFVSILGNWSFVQRQTDSTTNYTWWQNSQSLQLLSIDMDKTNAVTKASHLVSSNVGVAPITQPSSSFNLYPNPASEMAYLSYQNKTSGPVTIQLMDISGRLVADLLNENQSVGMQKLPIDITALHLPKGMYFVQLNSSNSLQTIKLSID